MIKYVEGDLFELYPHDKPIVIPHICNDIGLMASGFVVPLCRRWPIVKQRYEEGPIFKQRYEEEARLKLGATQFIKVADNIVVANMIAQHETIRTVEKPIRYAAIVACMQDVCSIVQSMNAEIHAPKFGSDRARGNWAFIEELIVEMWCGRAPVTIYYLPQAKAL